jgi:co-chaperonin GroES (HSP10)
MKLRMTNKFWLVKLEEELKQLANGLTVKETRGKRDIVIGVVIHGDYSPEFPAADGYHVWFPLYAANPITVEGNEYLVVHQDDIIMVESFD